jgi:hypothetical protein
MRRFADFAEKVMKFRHHAIKNGVVRLLQEFYKALQGSGSAT